MHTRIQFWVLPIQYSVLSVMYAEFSSVVVLPPSQPRLPIVFLFSLRIYLPPVFDMVSLPGLTVLFVDAVGSETSPKRDLICCSSVPPLWFPSVSLTRRRLFSLVVAMIPTDSEIWRPTEFTLCMPISRCWTGGGNSGRSGTYNSILFPMRLWNPMLSLRSRIGQSTILIRTSMCNGHPLRLTWSLCWIYRWTSANNYAAFLSLSSGVCGRLVKLGTPRCSTIKSYLLPWLAGKRRSHRIVARLPGLVPHVGGSMPTI